MSYLLDTDIISVFNKRTLPLKLVAWLTKNESDSFISLVSIAEMRHGLSAAPDTHREELTRRMELTEERFGESFVPVDLSVLTRWKRLLAELKHTRRTMTCEDSLLAATCLTHGFVMVTNNVRHFEPARQFGLEIKNPLA